ncbi:NAD(P)H-hydrate epimerase [Cryobacterium sp. BB736]|uniref:NAD(P)H-hydrate epimerase n=1 Tax=Cryobacterium sp. BB736 TaxID=2746963 RepID=UPI0018735F19|nr:NAD(P)H-hydrate epimerase [Cryobacterium sp. BB736]
MHGYTANQIRTAEKPLLKHGVPLMARAAAGLARELRALLPDGGGRILVLAGSGDNGGDALFAAAELASDGADVSVIQTGSTMHERAAAAAMVAGANVIEPRMAAQAAEVSDVVLDGILGTGASRSPALRDTAREVVALVLPVLAQPKRPLVVAVDIPSGIHPDDGSVPDPTVLPADVTVTFGGCKAGLLLDPASRLAGRIVLVDIGLGPALGGVEPAVTTPDR